MAKIIGCLYAPVLEELIGLETAIAAKCKSCSDPAAVDELIALATASGAGCLPCLEYHLRHAREIGVAREDVQMAVSAGRKVYKETRQKRKKLAAQQARAAPEETSAQRTMQVRVKLSGVFGKKPFLVKLEELIRKRPYDIINLQLQVPTVKGAREKAPSFMAFEVTSTEQEDIQSFMPELRAMIRDNGLVLVSERKL